MDFDDIKNEAIYMLTRMQEKLQITDDEMRQVLEIAHGYVQPDTALRPKKVPTMLYAIAKAINEQHTDPKRYEITDIITREADLLARTQEREVQGGQEGLREGYPKRR